MFHATQQGDAKSFRGLDGGLELTGAAASASAWGLGASVFCGLRSEPAHPEKELALLQA